MIEHTKTALLFATVLLLLALIGALRLAEHFTTGFFAYFTAIVTWLLCIMLVRHR